MLYNRQRRSFTQNVYFEQFWLSYVPEKALPHWWEPMHLSPPKSAYTLVIHSVQSCSFLPPQVISDLLWLLLYYLSWILLTLITSICLCCWVLIVYGNLLWNSILGCRETSFVYPLICWCTFELFPIFRISLFLILFVLGCKYIRWKWLSLW